MYDIGRWRDGGRRPGLRWLLKSNGRSGSPGRLVDTVALDRIVQTQSHVELSTSARPLSAPRAFTFCRILAILALTSSLRLTVDHPAAVFGRPAAPRTLMACVAVVILLSPLWAELPVPGRILRGGPFIVIDVSGVDAMTSCISGSFGTTSRSDMPNAPSTRCSNISMSSSRSRSRSCILSHLAISRSSLRKTCVSCMSDSFRMASTCACSVVFRRFSSSSLFFCCSCATVANQSRQLFGLITHMSKASSPPSALAQSCA